VCEIVRVGGDDAVVRLFRRRWLRDTASAWYHRSIAFSLLQCGVCFSLSLPLAMFPCYTTGAVGTSIAGALWMQSFIAVRLQLLRTSNTSDDIS
jgi:hypothetical protein